MEAEGERDDLQDELASKGEENGELNKRLESNKVRILTFTFEEEQGCRNGNGESVRFPDFVSYACGWFSALRLFFPQYISTGETSVMCIEYRMCVE